MFLEYKSFLKQKKAYKSNIYQEINPLVKDKDVVNKRLRIMNTNNNVIIVCGMRKKYSDRKHQIKVWI